MRKTALCPIVFGAAAEGKEILVRNPFSIRPYQHVLEPLFAYLLIAKRQYEDRTLADWYNVGPDEADCMQTGALVELFVRHWGDGLSWTNGFAGGRHEANYLKLDCSKIKTALNWYPRWDVETAIAKTVQWSKSWLANGDIETCMDKQIVEFLTAWKNPLVRR